MAGLIINLEGLDGSGKSTVCRKVVDDLKKDGIEVSTYREPGGSEIGNQIREVLHTLRNEEMDYRTELLLYQASRAQLVGQILNPGLKENKIFILDRFVDSTRAYQGEGRGINREDLEFLIKFATNGLTSDLTILFDIPVEIMNERLKDTREFNRMDTQSTEFYQTVRKAYLQMAAENKDGRWVIVDATRPFEEVAITVKTIIEGKILTHQTREGQRHSTGKER